MGKNNDNVQNGTNGVNFRQGGFGSKRGHMKVVVKPKNFKKTISRLWKYFAREQKILFIIFIFVIVSSIISLTIPYLIGKSIDSMSINSGIVDFKLLKIVIITLITAYVIDGVINIYRGFMVAKVSQRIVKKLRKALFDKLQKLPIAFFDRSSNGDIMSRLSNDIDNVSTTLSQSTIHLMSGSITLVGALGMMIYLSIPLTFASVITIPFVFLLTKTVASKTKVLFKNQQVELGKLNGNIEETISGIYVVKAFNNEEKVIKDFKEVNNKLCEVGIKAQILSGIIMPLMNVINNLGFAAV
ncbi:MAG: ABC transporter ATP-binding protein, partial [Clostridium sp.]